MKFIDITYDNWKDVIFLTTNKSDMPTLCEEFIASNALSIVQAFYEKTWITKAIEHNEILVGFAMYGFNKDEDFYELCRIMIDKRFQGNGYGSKAIKMIIDEMKQIYNCKEIYLSTDPDNKNAIRLYKKLGFNSTGRVVDNEDLYCYTV